MFSKYSIANSSLSDGSSSDSNNQANDANKIENKNYWLN